MLNLYAGMSEQLAHRIEVASGCQSKHGKGVAAGVEADILFYPCGSGHLFKASVAGTKTGHVKDLLPRLAAVSIRQPFQRRLAQGYRYLFPGLLHGLD